MKTETIIKLSMECDGESKYMAVSIDNETLSNLSDEMILNVYIKPLLYSLSKTENKE